MVCPQSQHGALVRAHSARSARDRRFQLGVSRPGVDGIWLLPVLMSEWLSAPAVIAGAEDRPAWRGVVVVGSVVPLLDDGEHAVESDAAEWHVGGGGGG